MQVLGFFMSLEDCITYHKLDVVDSTQTWAKSHYERFSLKKIHVVSAQAQTKGKGTYGKTWHSPEGMNLYATLCFEHHLELPAITLVASLAICAVLNHYGIKPQIKWPNDILVHESKICGLLCETQPLGDNFLYLIGLGLNVNMGSTELEKISQKATSMSQVLGQLIDTDILLSNICESIQKSLIKYTREGFAPFQEEYNALMIYTGYPLQINNKTAGFVKMVDADGSLLIDSLDGIVTSTKIGSIVTGTS